MFAVKRIEENPLLSPHPDHPWEAAAAFNWCPAEKGETLHFLYRAMSEPELLDETHLQLSVIGHTSTKDGVHFEDRRPFVVPEYEWEKYGCEDPRVTKFGGTYYIFYTALSSYPFRADSIKIALAKTKDLKKITEKHLVTPFNAKAMALFPEKVNGKFGALLTVDTDNPPAHICYAEFDKEEEMWSPEFWSKWRENMESHRLEVRRAPADQVELGSPPIAVPEGWLVIYSHIKNYFNGRPIFGVEALLLDRDNPRKIIGRTTWPIMVPETQYERLGNVPNIVFPSGARVEGEDLYIYYGAADTHCAAAKTSLTRLVEAMTLPGWRNNVERFQGNPIIAPRPGLPFEAKGAFNPAAIELQGTIHLLYRAFSDNNISTIGYAATNDGFSIDERLREPIYWPRADFESRGCEDPRIVEIDGRLYMTYTGFDGSVPRVAISSISVSDFLAKKWNWSEPFALTPPNIPDKDAVIFPEKINGKYMLIHRVHDSVCADFVDTLDFSKERITECIEMLGPRRGMWDEEKVGIAAPPLKTPKGWLMLYHGVSERTIYRVGAVLLNKENPTEIIARTTAPILEPMEDYERNGFVPNVVFPCGMVLRGQELLIYYGAADSTVGVVSIKMPSILKALE